MADSFSRFGETRAARCEAERLGAVRATAALQDSLNGGPFTMRVEAGTDGTDRYGRDLRAALRKEGALSGYMVRGKLARSYGGEKSRMVLDLGLLSDLFYSQFKVDNKYAPVGFTKPQKSVLRKLLLHRFFEREFGVPGLIEWAFWYYIDIFIASQSKGGDRCIV